MNITNDNQLIGNFDMNRMFSLKYPYKFHSRIHEQIKMDGSDMYNRKGFSNPVRIRVFHDGYTASAMKQKDKLNRNIQLLKIMVDEEPGNPAWLFFYGRELCTSGRTDEGIASLLQCEERAKEYPNFGRLLDVHGILVNAYLSKRDLDSAEEVCIRSMEIRKDFPDILYAYSRIKLERSLQLLNEAENYVVNSLNSFESYRSLVSPDEAIRNWKGDLLYSDIALCQGKIAKAVQSYNKALISSPASVKSSITDKLNMINSEIKTIVKYIILSYPYQSI